MYYMYHVYSGRGWVVPGRADTSHTDTIFFAHPQDVRDVRLSLIKHDGYPDDIIVTEECAAQLRGGPGGLIHREAPPEKSA